MKTLFQLKNVEFTLTEKLNMQNPSYYVLKAFEKYNQGLINFTEYMDVLSDVQEYAHLWEEVNSTEHRLNQITEKLNFL
jgi:flagellum-specific peptidoglycan hydrolase FlgJ